MKITCIQENLNKALIHSSRIISVRNSLPILDNVLMSTDKGRLRISATDLECVSGQITFNEVGDPNKKAAIIKVENGKFVFQKFVQP